MQFRFVLSLALFFQSQVGFPSINADDFPILEDWEKSEETREYEPANLFDYINGAADVYLSYGFVHIWIKEYKHSSGSRIKAEIYEHQDTNHAFGIYSIERAPKYEFLDIGGQAYQIEDILNMVCGKYYVKLHGYDLDNAGTAALKHLAGRLADNLDKDTHLPEILGKFPVKNKMPNSEMYIAENFLGFDFLKNAFASVYENDDQTFQLFVLIGENKNDCQQMLENYMKFTRQDSEILQEGNMLIEDRYNGDVYIYWQGSYIFGTVECSDEDICKIYLESFKTNLTE